MRLNRKQIEEVLPEKSVRAAFMRRPDIAPLPEEEREGRWQVHLERLQPFLNFLTRVDCYVIPDGRPAR